MISETLARLEALAARIKAADPKSKAELLVLLEKLKGEISKLEASRGDEARSVMGFAEAAAHEATRKQRSPELLELSLKGLSGSVKSFEASHPKLTETVNALASFLSNLGI